MPRWQRPRICYHAYGDLLIVMTVFTQKQHVSRSDAQNLDTSSTFSFYLYTLGIRADTLIV